MTFADIISALSKELGTEIETEGDVCAIQAGSKDGASVTVVLHGLDERGAILFVSDLGEPPPEGRDRLMRVLLEANDLFRNTAGATLSLDPDSGRIRLQRTFSDDALVQGGIGIAFAAFADAAVAWQSLVADFRTSPPESRAGKVSDGGPPPDLGVFV